MAALLAATVVSPTRLHAQEPLAFLNFRPGASRPATELVVRGHGGRWRCRPSAADDRFAECQGTVAPEGEPRLQLVASLVHDSLAVLLLSGPVPEADLARWRAELDRRIGPAAVRTTQGQMTWQWVRARRMIRITTRAEGAAHVTSVSLVDGLLLDGLEEPRARR